MNYLKVLLLDDEVLIRKLIRMKLDTEKLQVEIAGEFSDAASAMKAAEELRPDIIISDICMPEVDGLSFSEQCREVLPDAKIIILTGYNDFEYARRGLKAGVYDYLMKPVQTEELNKAVKRAADQIRIEYEERENQKKLLEARTRNQAAVRDSYLRELMTGEADTEQILQRFLELGFQSGKSGDGYMQIGIVAVRESLDRPEALSRVKRESREFFLSESGIYEIVDPWGRLAVICYEENETFAECFSMLLELLSKKTDYHIQAGLSDAYDSLKDFRRAYLDAIEKSRIAYGENQTEKSIQEDVTKAAGEGWKRVSRCIIAGEAENMSSAVQAALLEEGERLTRKRAKSIVNKLCIDSKVSFPDLDWETLLPVCRTRSDLCKYIEAVAVFMIVKKGCLSGNARGELMDRILDFMMEHLEKEDLNMNVILSEFGISASFFGRILKTYTGRTYSEILSNLRYWRLLTLLDSYPEMRTTELGEKIGICDAHYLSIWFKKQTGCSITEYRQKNEIC